MFGEICIQFGGLSANPGLTAVGALMGPPDGCSENCPGISTKQSDLKPEN